jgi:hypothetical protein
MMARWKKLGLAVGLLVAAVLTGYAQRPDDGPALRKDGKGPPPGKGPRFVLGRVLPPPLYEQLDLTPEQKKKLDAIEAELKKKLDALFTEKQKRLIEDFRPRGPGGPPGGKRPGKGKDGDRPPPPPGSDASASNDAGIQWYATLERGLAEAKRTGKPILFLSAAPHCGGVPGIW